MKKSIFISAVLAFSLITPSALGFLKNDFFVGYAESDNLEIGQYSSTTQGSTNPILLNQWNLSGNTSNQSGSNPKVIAPLSYTGYVQNDKAIEMKNETGNRISIYSLADNNNDFATGTYYISLLVNFSKLSTTYQDFFCFDTNYTGNTARGKVAVKKEGESQLSFAMVVNGSTWQASAKILNMGETALLVLKYDFTTTTASLFVNPAIAETEPTPDATDDGTVSGSGTITAIRGIQIKQRTAYEGAIGNFRFADTWADAIGYVPTTSIETVAIEKTVVEKNYFNVSGQKVHPEYQGLLLEKVIYEDGTSKTVKHWK
ncbi:hypothetical protein FACS1894176_03950 [Bacteroidia bacterium]|nr:hypothetical protein FACS1894176_03950 [Bacteroidia bacterium]